MKDVMKCQLLTFLNHTMHLKQERLGNVGMPTILITLSGFCEVLIGMLLIYMHLAISDYVVLKRKQSSLHRYLKKTQLERIVTRLFEFCNPKHSKFNFMIYLFRPLYYSLS